MNLEARTLIETTPYPNCPGPYPFDQLCTLPSSFCGVPALTGSDDLFIGDVAANRVTDTVLVTDGFVVYEFVGDTPCGSPPPCTAVNAFEIPTSLGMGPIRGMGLDPFGTLAGGAPTLWITDGTSIAGLGYGPCTATVLIPPCEVTDLVGYTMTDVTWNTGTAFGPGVFVSLDAGVVAFIEMPGCSVLWGASTGWCLASLTGLAFDVTTPNAMTGQPDSLIFTDGQGIGYMNVPSGFVETPFHNPLECSSAGFPLPTHGLAINLHGINSGLEIPEPDDMHIDAYGSSVSPSPEFGIEVHNVPPGSYVVAAVNDNPATPSATCVRPSRRCMPSGTSTRCRPSP